MGVMTTPALPAPGGVSLGAGRVEWDARGAVSITGASGEAVASDGVAAALAALAVSGATAGPLVGRPSSSASPAVSGAESAFAADVDMTSWALIVGSTHIVKVPRHLGTADRGARLQRLVAESAPALVPPVVGTVEHADTGTVVAVVTVRVPDATDGWSWAVDALMEHLDGGADPSFPDELGTLTAQLHVALAAATATSRTTPRARGAEERAAAVAVLADVIAHGAGAAERPGAAQRLAARSAALRDVIDALPDPTAPEFALHGDLHVGQVLRDGDGRLRVIDFDGDPQHPAGDDVGDAARDVAHLQVSIDLVGAIVAKRRGADDTRIAQWCRTAQERLVAAYDAVAPSYGGQPLLDPARLPGLRAARLVRELRYARDFLPRWAYAADWAIAHRFSADPNLEDPPWTPPASSTT